MPQLWDDLPALVVNRIDNLRPSAESALAMEFGDIWIVESKRSID
jgi:hypothetical protein